MGRRRGTFDVDEGLDLAHELSAWPGRLTEAAERAKLAGAPYDQARGDRVRRVGRPCLPCLEQAKRALRRQQPGDSEDEDGLLAVDLERVPRRRAEGAAATAAAGP